MFTGEPWVRWPPWQVHAQHRVAGLDKRKINRHVGLRTRVRLYVGVLRAEELFRPLNGQVFHLVHALAAAIVALAGITLGVFIGENRSHGRHNSRRDQILRGDQFNISSLTASSSCMALPNSGHIWTQSQWCPAYLHTWKSSFLWKTAAEMIRFSAVGFIFFSFIILTQTKKINSFVYFILESSKKEADIKIFIPARSVLEPWRVLKVEEGEYAAGAIITYE